MMHKKVHPGVAAIAIILAIVVLFLSGRHFLKAEESAVGVNKDGSVMTPEQGAAFGRAMSGGHSDAARGGKPAVEKADKPENPTTPTK